MHAPDSTSAWGTCILPQLNCDLKKEGPVKVKLKISLEQFGCTEHIETRAVPARKLGFGVMLSTDPLSYLLYV